MSGSSTVFYQCSNPKCSLRIPAGRIPGPQPPLCPRCKSSLHPVPTVQDVANFLTQKPSPPSQPFLLEALLDNIRSTFNVGAMFRAADGAGVRHLYLCGLTPLPGNPRISKTALGAEHAVAWEYAPNGLQMAESLVSDGKSLWALETTPDAVSLFDIDDIPPHPPIVLVVGNEVSGIDPQILSLCSKKIFIPMSGYKNSLNVAVAFGIAVYHLMFGVHRHLTDPQMPGKIHP